MHRSICHTSASFIFIFVTVFSAMTMTIRHAKADVFYPACSDGVDNDSDGHVDFPNDPDCTSAQDNNENPHYNQGVIAQVTDGRTYAAPGKPISYTITLRPNFTNTYRNVSMDFYLPNGVVFLNADKGGVMTNGRIHWSNITVSSMETNVITVNANVSQFVSDGQNLVARLLVDGQEYTDTSTVNYRVIDEGSQFRLQLVTPNQSILPGSTVHYMLKIQNRSNTQSATNIKITTPPLAEVRNASDYAIRDKEQTRWENIVLAPGEERIFTFDLMVDRNAPNYYVIKTIAQAGSTITSDSLKITKTITSPDMSISIVGVKPSVKKGETQTYRVTLQNNSSKPGTNVSVTAALPLYGQFISADQGGYWDGSNVRWQGIRIEPHGTRTVSFTVIMTNNMPTSDSSNNASASVNSTIIASEKSIFVAKRQSGETAYPDYSYDTEDGMTREKMKNGNFIEPHTGVSLPRTGADSTAMIGLLIGFLGVISAKTHMRNKALSQ